MLRTRIYVMRWTMTLLVTAALAGTASAAPPDHAGGPGKSGKSAPGQSKHMDKGNKPEHRGSDKGHKAHKGGSHDDRRGDHRDGDQRHGDRGGLDVDVFFDARHRDIIRGYYGSEFRGGNCPPGLAKKRNGCMPPGQAKKWRVGHPLPGDVDYYPVPHDLERILGYDNPAYKLIRVGGDILRIGVGTGIVVEAVEDLGGLF